MKIAMMCVHTATCQAQCPTVSKLVCTECLLGEIILMMSKADMFGLSKIVVQQSWPGIDSKFVRGWRGM